MQPIYEKLGKMAAIRNIMREVINYKEFASGEEARRIASTRPKTGQSL